MRMTLFALPLILLLGQGTLAAQDATGLAALPDHRAARERFQSELLTAPTEIALRFEARGIDGPEGRTELYIRREVADFYIHVASQPAGQPASPGDYIVRRNLKSGYLLDITVILSPGGGSYLHFHPKGQSMSMDVVIEGKKLHAGILLGMPLYYLLARPLSLVQDLAGKRVDWSAVLAAAGVGGD